MYAKIDSNDVKPNTSALPVPSLYIEKDDGKPLEISKIILGPKVEEPSKIVPYIKYANPKIKVVKSNVEFR